METKKQRQLTVGKVTILYNKGYSMSKISEITKLPESTVRDICNKYGKAMEMMKEN